MEGIFPLGRCRLCAVVGIWADLRFRDPLLALVAKGSKVLLRKGSHAAEPIMWHGEEKGNKGVTKGRGKPGFPASGAREQL